MRVMAFRGDGPRLAAEDRPDPVPGPGQVRVRVEACGVCRTDLHILDGELVPPRLPVVPGHEVVGRVERLGPGVSGLVPGQRVGVPWLGRACGACEACREGRENLCPAAEFTGLTRDGGYAEACLADAAFVVPLPGDADPVALAPLLCAGLIGFRAWRLAAPPGRPVRRVGLYGFGAAAHLLAQLARAEGVEVHAVTRDGDRAAQDFARSLGAAWAGGASEDPPAPLDAALLFAPDGALVPRALGAVRPGGRVVCGGIHMSDIPAFPYARLWGERSLMSVANLTREDAALFLPRAAAAGIRAETRAYPLAEAGAALDDLRAGRVRGAAVLVP